MNSQRRSVFLVREFTNAVNFNHSTSLIPPCIPSPIVQCWCNILLVSQFCIDGHFEAPTHPLLAINEFDMSK